MEDLTETTAARPAVIIEAATGIFLRYSGFELFVSLRCNSIERSDTRELNNLVGEGPRRFLGNVMATSFEHAAADVSGH